MLDGGSVLRLNDGSFLNPFLMAGALLSVFVVGPIVVLFCGFLAFWRYTFFIVMLHK